jgi:Zn-dependent protease
VDPSLPRHPVLRALGYRVRLGRPFGVPVDMHVLALVLSVGFVTWEWTRVHAPFGEALVAGILFTALLYFLIWAHEMGHVLAGRRYHIPTSRITLWPLGGLAHLSDAAPSPRADIVIALAGPATHLVGLALAWPLRAWIPYGAGLPAGWIVDPLHVVVEAFWYLNLGLALFNLLPFLPMDGGRVLMGILTLRRGEVPALRTAALVGLVGAVAMGLFALFVDGGWRGGLLLAIALSNGLFCWRMRTAARHGARWYAERAREPWELDPDGWRGGAPGAGADDRKQVRAARRAAERLQSEAGRRAEEDAEVDRLLARVSEVGLGGLSRRERKRLEDLSRRRGAG